MTFSHTANESGNEEDVDGVGDDNTPNSVSDIQEHRQQLMSEGCRKLSNIVNRTIRAWHEMYYDDQMDYVYCLVSKAACTSLKSTLMMLNGNLSKFQRPEKIPWGMVHDHRNSDKYIERLEKVPPAYRYLRFKDNRYFTFMFVREPLERLVSAYRDKLAEHDYRHLDVTIVQKYRPHEYNASMKRYNVTFAEFVRYVLDEHAAGRELDRHWIPQNELCRVCQLRWDFIGHHETLLEDADYVVSKLKSRIMNIGQRSRVANITFPADGGHRKSSDFLKQMYASVPAAHVKLLYQLYADDYALLGFKHPDITGFNSSVRTHKPTDDDVS